MIIKYIDDQINQGWYVLDEYGIVYHGIDKPDCEQFIYENESEEN